MTHGDFPPWVNGAMTAAASFLLVAPWRFLARRIKMLVELCVPARFALARQALGLILGLICSVAIAVSALLILILAYLALESV